MDDDANYENDDEPEVSEDEDSESDVGKEGLGLSEDEEVENTSKDNKNKKKKKEQHPLIRSGDFRDKDTKRQHRVQLWFERENLRNVDDEEYEDLDMDILANYYKKKGITVLGESQDTGNSNVLMGQKAKRRARHEISQKESSSESSSDSSDEENEDEDEDDKKTSGDMSKEPKAKKIRLTPEELALGALLIKGKKTRRDLIDAAYNRYAFNDEDLPSWFVKDEELHMRRPIPVPTELAEEYQRNINQYQYQELNVRPIKKVMEAKARKRRRAAKRLAKAKKQAEKIMENADSTAQEKARQIKKIYKKAEEKKKEVTYVVAKKHQAGRRVRRPPGVKGRYKIVDPRQKKDKRALNARNKRNNHRGKGKK